MADPQIQLPVGYRLDTPSATRTPAPGAAAQPSQAQPQPGLFSRLSHFVSDTLGKTAGNLDITPMLQRIGEADTLAGQGRWADAWNEIRDMLPGGSPSQQVLGNRQGTTFQEQKEFVKDTIQKAKTGDYSGAAANVLTAGLANAEHGAPVIGRGAAKAADVVSKVPEATRQAVDAASDATAAARNAAADALDRSAQKGWGTALNPTTKIDKALTGNQVAQGLIDRGVKANSLDDLRSQAQERIEDLGSQIDDAFEKHANAGTKVSPQPILDKLEQEKQHNIVDGVPVDEAHVDRTTGLQKQIEDISNANGGDIPLASLRSVRQILDKKIARSKGGFALPPDAASAIDAYKTYTDAIRSTVAETDPELAGLNKEFSFWKNVDKVAGDTLTRRTGQRGPLTQWLGAALGGGVGGALGDAVAGPWGASVGSSLGTLAGKELAKFGNSTFVKSRTALAKSKLADMIRADEETPTPATAGLARDAADVAESGHATGAGATRPVSQGQSGAVSEAASGSPGAAGGSAAGGATGAATAVKVPGSGGPGYRATYRVRELNDVQPSHSGLTFRENPKYELTNDRDYQNAVNQAKIVNGSLPSQFDPSFHITDNPDATNGPLVIGGRGNVLGGNGRAMMLQRVYGAQNAKAANAYRQMLIDKAGQFGIDPAAVKGMNRPVLVRELDPSELATPEKVQNAIADFNKKGTAELTPGERAISDSRRVSDETLEDMAGRLEAKGPNATIADVLEGKSGAEVLQKLIDDGVISPQERAAFRNEGGLTKAGRDRISQLMIGRFFRDPAQLDSIAPSVRGKVERIAAPLAQVESKPEWNLSPDVQSAIDLAESARKAGIRSLDDFIKQDGLFGKAKYSDRQGFTSGEAERAHRCGTAVRAGCGVCGQGRKHVR